jgi:hypothetical protein
MSVRGFLRQQYRYGQGAARYRRAGSDRRRGSIDFYLGLLRAGFAAGLVPGLFVATAQLATVAGVLRESAKMRLYDDFSRTR